MREKLLGIKHQVDESNEILLVIYYNKHYIYININIHYNKSIEIHRAFGKIHSY